MQARPLNSQHSRIRANSADAAGKESGPQDPNHPDPNAQNTRLPERYVVKTNGNERFLTCLEAPNLNVHMEAGLTFSAAIARKSPSGTIFLDGVAQCEPFMDHERQIYNLDHHEGCVRAFTLSTCEQALVVYMKGLDLRNREWHVFANEPDLDTLLALWILLNHSRIGNLDAIHRRLLFALVRYEGVIDALGLELKEFSALPVDLMRKMQHVIDHLRGKEIELKKEGLWEQTDFLTYTLDTLVKIDQIFYRPSDFADYQGMTELARIDLSEQRIAAVVEADMGIYEIEPHLNKVYGDRLGVVFLKKGANTYTVRQMDLFLPNTLATIYDRLNFVDAAVRCRTNANKWGGASDIGGSPRDTGTALTPLEIVQACRDAVTKFNWIQKTYQFFMAAMLTGLILFCAHAVRLIWAPDIWMQRGRTGALWSTPDFGFIVTLLAVSGVGLAFAMRGRSWQYGWSAPIGKDWWALLPVALAGGLLGGTGMVPHFAGAPEEWPAAVLMGTLLMPLGFEVLFRGLVHGRLAQNSTIQRGDTRWFLSWPILGSALLHIASFAILCLADHADDMTAGWHTAAIRIGGVGLLALAAGFARERSQSLFPPVFLHMLGAIAALSAQRMFI